MNTSVLLAFGILLLVNLIVVTHNRKLSKRVKDKNEPLRFKPGYDFEPGDRVMALTKMEYAGKLKADSTYEVLPAKISCDQKIELIRPRKAAYEIVGACYEEEIF